MNDVAPRPRAAGAPRRLRAFEALGLELEYMIVDATTLDVKPVADRVLRDLAGGAPAGTVDEVAREDLAWSNELVLHVVELKNPQPAADLERLALRLQHEVRAMNRALLAHAARLMPGGMHPWMDPARETVLWPHGNRAVYRAYDAIFGCAGHGWSNLQSMHINLPFGDDREFERLHAAVRLVLPLLPALAASSPYAEGRMPGPMDYRMEVYRHNQAALPSLTGQVVPDVFTDREEYENRLLAPMYRDIAPHDPDGILQHEWLNSHGAIARFDRHAIEVRVMDTQECPRADVALAALVLDLVMALYREDFAPLRVQQALETAPLAALLRQCIRDGERALVNDEAYRRLFDMHDGPCTAQAWWHHVGERLRAEGARHAALWDDALDLYLTHGPLARRLVTAAGVAPAPAQLAALYERLCDALARGDPFLP